MESSFINGFHKTTYSNPFNSSTTQADYIQANAEPGQYNFGSSNDFENSSQENSVLQTNYLKDTDLKMEYEQNSNESNCEDDYDEHESFEYFDENGSVEYYDENDGQVIHVFAVDPELDLEYSSDEDVQTIVSRDEEIDNGEESDYVTDEEEEEEHNSAEINQSDVNERISYSESVDLKASNIKKEVAPSTLDDLFALDEYLIDNCILNSGVLKPKSFSLPHSPLHLDVQDERTSLSFEDFDLSSFNTSCDISEEELKPLLNGDIDSILDEQDDQNSNKEQVNDDLNHLDMEIEKPIVSNLNPLVETPNVKDSSSVNILDFCIEKKVIPKTEKLDSVQPRVEEDFVDVESVNECSTAPILKAANINTLLEEFEASEKINNFQPPLDISEIKTDEKYNKTSKPNRTRQQEAAKHLNENKIKHLMMSPPSSNSSTHYNSSQESVHSDHDYCTSIDQSTMQNKAKKFSRKRQSLLKPDLFIEYNDNKTSLPRSCKSKNIDYSISSDDDTCPNKGRYKNQLNNNKKIVKVKDKTKNVIIENTQSVNSKSEKNSFSNCISVNVPKSNCDSKDNQNGNIKLLIKNRSKVIVDTCDKLDIKDVKVDKSNSIVIQLSENNDCKKSDSSQEKCNKVTTDIQNNIKPNIAINAEALKIFDPITEASKKIARILNSKKLKADAIRRKEEELIQRNIPKMENLELKPLITDEQMLKLAGLTPESLSPMISPGRLSKDFEEICMLSIGTNTDLFVENDDKNENKINFKIKKTENVMTHNVFEEKKANSVKLDETGDGKICVKRFENIAATLESVKQNYDGKISSNSLFASIQKTIFKKDKQNESLKQVAEESENNLPKFGRKFRTIIINESDHQKNHGEDKIILHLPKGRSKPETVNVETQTDFWDDVGVQAKQIVSKSPNNEEKTNKSRSSHNKTKDPPKHSNNHSGDAVKTDLRHSEKRVKKRSRSKEPEKSRRPLERESRHRRSNSRSRDKALKSRRRYYSRDRHRRSRSVKRSYTRQRSISSERRKRRYSRSRSCHRRRSRSPYFKRDRSSDRRNYRSRDRKRKRSSSRDSRHKSPDQKKTKTPLVTPEKIKREIIIDKSPIKVKLELSPRQKTSSESSDASTTSISSSDSRDSESPSRTPPYPYPRRSSSLDGDLKPVEERRIVFVGKLTPDVTKQSLRTIFQKFGPITDVRLHTKDNGGRFGFVTFSKAKDAWRAVGAGDSEGHGFTIGFGGRRAFCRQTYADLDGLEAEYSEYMIPPLPIKEDDISFDRLLQEMKKKLNQKKKSDDIEIKTED